MFGKMEYAPILPLSALHGKGVKDLLKETLAMYEQLNRTVETAALNLALKTGRFIIRRQQAKPRTLKYDI